MLWSFEWPIGTVAFGFPKGSKGASVHRGSDSESTFSRCHADRSTEYRGGRRESSALPGRSTRFVRDLMSRYQGDAKIAYPLKIPLGPSWSPRETKKPSHCSGQSLAIRNWKKKSIHRLNLFINIIIILFMRSQTLNNEPTCGRSAELAINTAKIGIHESGL